MKGTTASSTLSHYPEPIERKEWCTECGAFLMCHVYRQVPNGGDDEGSSLLWDRTELAPGFVTSEPASAQDAAHYTSGARRPGQRPRGNATVIRSPGYRAVLHCLRCGAQRMLYTPPIE